MNHTAKYDHYSPGLKYSQRWSLLDQIKFTLVPFIISWCLALCHTSVVPIQPQHSRRLLKNSNNRKRQHWTEWKFMECHYIDIFITENTIPRMTNDWFVFNQANRHATTQKPQCTCWKTWLAICLINCNQSTCFQRFVLFFFSFMF